VQFELPVTAVFPENGDRNPDATIRFRPSEPLMEHIRHSLQQVLVDAVRRAPAEDVPLLAWPLACGSAVADKTRVMGFADGELVIQVPDAPWRTQLLGLATEYLRHLDEITVGRVQRLRFVLPGELEQR
jgi:Dna[CI] antecedent, DciA